MRHAKTRIFAKEFYQGVLGDGRSPCKARGRAASPTKAEPETVGTGAGGSPAERGPIRFAYAMTAQKTRQAQANFLGRLKAWDPKAAALAEPQLLQNDIPPSMQD
jgi:hypothetical protein